MIKFYLDGNWDQLAPLIVSAKIYLRIIYTESVIYENWYFCSTITESMHKVCISMVQGLQLRGDVLIKCYNKKAKASTRDVIFRCQFHTCAVSETGLVFSKKDLDDACSGSMIMIPESRLQNVVFVCVGFT